MYEFTFYIYKNKGKIGRSWLLMYKYTCNILAL